MVTFASPASNNSGSHFQDLDVSSTSNQLTLNSDVFVAGTLIGQPLPAQISSAGRRPGRWMWVASRSVA